MNSVHRFGDVEVRRVTEWVGPIQTVDVILPDTPAQVWREHEPWLVPDFYIPDDNSYRGAIQTWILRVGGQTILVDTGVGNDRERPQVPLFDHLRTDFLDRLGAAGVDLTEVDLVINTHIHYDHVGWNTTLVDGAFVPTFPNARYLVPERDYTYYRPENAAQMRPPQTEDERRRFEGIRLVYADSITPIEEAGQLLTWEGEYQVSEQLRLELAPGHTPGSSVLWLEAGDGAVFVGDLSHSPIQILRPDDACSFDLDRTQARRSRRQVLDHAAGNNVTVLPAHYPGHGGATITTHDDGYQVQQWADYPRT